MSRTYFISIGPDGVRSNLSGPASTELTSERLLSLLADAAAALEREALAVSAECRGGRAAALVGDLQRECQVKEFSGAAASGAGRVPLPSPSAEVDAALAALARVIAGGCALRSADERATACAALKAVQAVAFSAPQRAALIVRHGALMGALAGALAGARDEPRLLEAARDAAVRILLATSASDAAAWSAEESGANLRALAAALAGGLGALEALCGPESLERDYEALCFSALILAITACPDRRGLVGAMISQERFADALCAWVARAAASVPAPPGPSRGPCVRGALTLLAALASAQAFDYHLLFPMDGVVFLPRREMQRPVPAPAPREDRPPMERLLAAAPALLERVADVVAAGAPWYAAVGGALAPDGRRAVADDAATANFQDLALGVWSWALCALDLAPLSALTADAAANARGGGRGLVARLGPALLGLADAAQAVVAATAPSNNHLEAETAALAAAAARLFNELTQVLGSAAHAAMGGAPLSALAALARLSFAEPPRSSSARASERPADRRAAEGYFRARLWATLALVGLCYRNIRTTINLLALLITEPPVVAAAGAALGASRRERRLARGDAAFAVLLAQRRALTARLWRHLAVHAAADGAPRRCASWLRRLPA